MNVTKVDLNFPYKPGPRFKCWAKVVFDDVLLVTGIKLFENKKDGNIIRQIKFPDRRPSLESTGGEFVSIAIVNTNNDELREHITDVVFAEYDKHPNNPANWKKKENYKQNYKESYKENSDE